MTTKVISNVDVGQAYILCEIHTAADPAWEQKFSTGLT
jgi:hypothetical protein